MAQMSKEIKKLPGLTEIDLRNSTREMKNDQGKFTKCLTVPYLAVGGTTDKNHPKNLANLPSPTPEETCP